MKEIAIGTREQFEAFPAEVQVERRPYFLFEEEDGFKLMSRKCPHAGDTVELEDGELVCPLHGWTFETHTGRCHNIPSAQLANYEVILRDGILFVQMEE
ncbi:Rieske (2Fe-2S) protein [Paenibacillus sp. SYP-B3998]|uniref:Rieske (2Fe-2S) protein n=1 Tax=Paenibacillus sp. SYP-B3998 TaxID=2678564 RepID=A0A6G3ZS96_9BACL|nr:Rieske (2Fe-2S) protein [Paenibacillus sp. SYP-B3998]NEW04930.1 Rieske (2Fe-2S) protein [Paenibacillus sp. SYP-B3998]